MPKQKDLKRIVRSRMKKTGESYTAARLQVLEKKKEPPPDYATLAGMSDEAVKKATGCDWARWVKALDYAKANTMSHREITAYVKERFNTPDWWTQGVAVGYERIRGLRAIGQRRGGSWEASKSRTFGVTAERLFDAFAKPSVRSRWLQGVKLAIRKQTRPKTMRITWEEDATSVQLYFTAKGDAKSSVAVQHTKLPSKDAADRMKAWWADRLDALANLLA